MAGAALLLSAAQIALMNGLINQPPYRAIVGSLSNGATTQPASLNAAAASPSSSTAAPTNPGNPSGMAYDVVFDVVVEEEHTDELTITDHPVEQGAAITDNAYKNPAMVILQCGFSESGPSGNNGASGLLQRLYAFMLQIQSDRTPFTVYTGKRTYPNMLLKSIATRSNQETEHSLPLTLVCREIIIVQTSATTVSNSQAVQAQPQNTTPTVNSGNQQLAPAPYFVPLDSSLPGLP